MKKLLVAITALVLSLGFMSVGHAEEPKQEKVYLFFKSQSPDSYLFEEYTADGRTILVHVGKDDFRNSLPKILIRGDVFTGVFHEEELLSIKKVANIYVR